MTKERLDLIKGEDLARPPSKEDIESFLKFTKQRDRRRMVFSGRWRKDDIRPDTEGVMLVTEDGEFLGWGKVDRYDWFSLNIDPGGKTVLGPDSHFFHFGATSVRFNMALKTRHKYIVTKQVRKSLLDLVPD